MKLKKILETAKNITNRLFIVFYCDGEFDIKKVEMNTKNICLQTVYGPVFQIIGVFDDSEFINFIHSKKYSYETYQLCRKINKKIKTAFKNGYSKK